MTSSSKELISLLREAKRIAKDYRRLTGRPLGVTAEIAEYEAARLLKLELAPVRQAGYDAIRVTAAGVEKLQIKGRWVFEHSKGQKVGGFVLDREWHAALLVLLDQDVEASAIYEASRTAIEEALLKSGSKARKEGRLHVSEFKAIGRKVWPT